ncbi:MAG: NUDIX domain-containing protein [Chitinophagaceae bacterium]
MNSTTIYIGEKPLCITNALSEELRQLAATHGTIMLNHPETISLKKTIADLEDSPAKAAIVLTIDPAGVIETRKTILVYIQAGGGLVQNDLGEYLFIYRNGRWDLPKGKLDPGETIAECALREVTEETGLKEIQLWDFLLDTWHIYHGWGQHVLKQTSWFGMGCASGQLLKPQKEEGITEIAWIKREDWGKVLGETFPSVRDLLVHNTKLKM